MAGWLGRWLGGGVPDVVLPVPPVPVEAVYASSDPARADHAAIALSRLPEQFRRRRV